MAIKLVTFDLDNTLWDNTPVLLRAEQAMYDHLQQHAPALTQRYTQHELAMKRLALLESSPQLEAQVSKVRKLTMQHALEEIQHDAASIPPLVRTAFDRFYEERNKIDLFPHTLPMLEALKTQYTLGSITNGNSDLALIGIADYFAFSISAEKVGARKPRPNVFRAALYHGKVKPQEMIHIGDDPRDDVFGAQQLGIHTIWFNPGKKRWSDHSDQEPPTSIVHCLSEIPDIIKRF